MIEFIDKTATNSGTPLNRETMMALQGFEGKTTRMLENGDIVETNERTGYTKTTRLVGSGNTIQETFVGDKTITKYTTLSNGLVWEVIS